MIFYISKHIIQVLLLNEDKIDCKYSLNNFNLILMQNQASQNPWDDGFQINIKRFLHYQYNALLFFCISIGLLFVWGLKQLQSLIKKA